jgi:hypothetical protein
MEQKGTVIQLNIQGPNGGTLILVVDFELKTASLIEVNPRSGNKLFVLEVQDYKKIG